MAREINRLTSRQVLSVNTFGRHADGGGLYLYVAKDGSRRWIFIYVAKGRRREMGLGPAAGPKKAGISLADARRKAEHARRLRFDGLDPLNESRTRRAAKKSKTFGQFADELLPDIVKGFRNAIHRDQWRSTLQVYAKPIRSKAISEIDTEDILKILKPIWTTKAETAGRVRGRIERVLDAAKAKGLRSGDNPARWQGHLKELLARRNKLSRGHHAALPYENAAVFMQKLRERESVSARALEFTILTAARSGETLGARLNELDLDKALWIVPANRMKAGIEHRVPLTERAVKIVRDLMTDESTTDSFAFPGAKRGEPLSSMAMLQLLRDLHKGITVHGFRSTFRDWAGDATNFPRDLAEQALAHTIKNKAEAAYRRSDALEKRRKLMEAWERYLVAPPAGKVLHFRQVAE
ncbi:MAG: tyrosine-type recombinase/integrase [Afipia felis]|nr:tyrosine-type recombinase/integrase [Afipia felis]